MSMRTKACGAALGLIAAALAAPAIAAAAVAVQTQGDVTYVSGGAGDEEQEQILAMSKDYNLKLTMAVTAGNYVGGAKVRIVDAQGRAVLDAVADGPFLLAQLKPGAYTVTADLNGKELKQSAQVADGKQEQLKFTWPSE